MSTQSGRISRERAYDRLISLRHDPSGFEALLFSTATDLQCDNPGTFLSIQEARESVARGLWHHSAAHCSDTPIHEEIKTSLLTLFPDLI